MSKKTVEIVCVLDRSGSMAGLEKDVIGGFNSFIEEQRKVKGKARVTLAIFDTQYTLVYDRIKLKNVPELTSEVYWPRGGTALNDAIGTTIANLKKGSKGIFLIQTDGEENASQEYTNDSIKRLVSKKEKKGWNFIYLGADIDAFGEGMSRGFGNTVGYAKTVVGNKDMYGAVSAMAFTTRTMVEEGVKNYDVMANVDKTKLDVTETDSASA